MALASPRLSRGQPALARALKYPVPDPTYLARVRAHLALYEHPLLAFSAIEANGAIEIANDLKNSNVLVHTYRFPIHPRDLEHPQFAWNLQRQLYDALHDYFIEMFTRTPQTLNQ